MPPVRAVAQVRRARRPQAARYGIERGRTRTISARWKAMSSDGGGGVFPVRIIASRPPCLGLRAQVELGGASYTEVRPRATVVQHHDRKQPSQPTSPTCARPVTNGVAIKQRSQLRAENVDTVGATGESQSHLRTLAGPVPLSDGRTPGPTCNCGQNCDRRRPSQPSRSCPAHLLCPWP
jgi:hypothetical protein